MFQYVVTLGGKDGTLCLPFANPISSDQLSNEVVSTLRKRAVAASTTINASSDDKDSPYLSSHSSSTLSALHHNPTFLFIRNGKPILDLFSPIVINQTSTDNFGNSVFLTAVYRGALRGGKGGFGANLRAAGRTAGKKSTTDFGLCRDLQGRRLRDVNNEIRLKTWLAPSEVARREQLGADYRELKGEGGLSGWFLGVPSWADGVSGGSKGDSAGLMDRKRKTSLCVDWKKAREGRNPPSNAPRWWGCPRGRACDFAHGDEELRGGGGGRTESVAETAKKRALAERQARLDAYTKGLYVYGGGDNEEEEEEGREGSVNKRMHSSVAQGMLEASSSTSLASRMGGLVGKGGGVKRKRSIIGIDDHDDDDDDDDDDDKEAEEDDDGAIMIGFAKSKSKPSSKHGGTWKGVFSSKSSTATVGGVGGRDILNEDLPASSSSFPSILSVSETFSPLKWLVVSDAPTGRAVLGEASAAVEYHSISVTPLEETLIKEGEEGTIQSSSTSSSSMTKPRASYESSIAEVTGLIEFATVAVSGVHIKASSTSSLSSISSSPSSMVSPSSCRYYYEVELITCTGIAQIGWAIDGFAPNVGEGNGVGDCSKSWAFDGLRGLFWHGGDEDESEEDGGAVPFVGPTWAAGDVIGCWLRSLGSEERKEEKKIDGDHQQQHHSLIKDRVEIGLCVNGEAIGQAIVVEVDIGLRGGFFPAISIDAGEIVRVNLGRQGFAYPSGKTCMI